MSVFTIHLGLGREQCMLEKIPKCSEFILLIHLVFDRRSWYYAIGFNYHTFLMSALFSPNRNSNRRIFSYFSAHEHVDRRLKQEEKKTPTIKSIEISVDIRIRVTIEGHSVRFRGSIDYRGQDRLHNLVIPYSVCPELEIFPMKRKRPLDALRATCRTIKNSSICDSSIFAPEGFERGKYTGSKCRCVAKRRDMTNRQMNLWYDEKSKIDRICCVHFIFFWNKFFVWINSNSFIMVLYSECGEGSARTHGHKKWEQ